MASSMYCFQINIIQKIANIDDYDDYDDDKSMQTNKSPTIQNMYNILQIHSRAIDLEAQFQWKKSYNTNNTQLRLYDTHQSILLQHRKK